MAQPLIRRIVAQWRYFGALLRRFDITIVLAFVLLGAVPLLFWKFYLHADGTGISYGEAFHHVYFLLIGQPSLTYINNWTIEAMNLIVPPLGLLVVVDGGVRFAYLFFSKHHSDREWIEVVSQTLREHVIVCGAGRIGYRVAEQLQAMGRDVVVIEKREDSAFVSTLRDKNVPVLIDDAKNQRALERTNIRQAAAIVCATDDDLTNMNAALDARRLNPQIRVVVRLFDDELVAKVRDSFNAEALSTSALAAPAVALAALDPRIIHSFRVGSHLMVVSEFVVQHGVAGLRVSELRDRFGGLTLALRSADGAEQLHPTGETICRPADVLSVQCSYEDYVKLREYTRESVPPRFHPR